MFSGIMHASFTSGCYKCNQGGPRVPIQFVVPDLGHQGLLTQAKDYVIVSKKLPEGLTVRNYQGGSQIAPVQPLVYYSSILKIKLKSKIVIVDMNVYELWMWLAGKL